MTDPEIRIDPSRLKADPGTQVITVVTITNPGGIVEGFRLDVLGEGAPAWADVSPQQLSVYPRQEGRATVTFSIPPHGVPSGTVAFAVPPRWSTPTRAPWPRATSRSAGCSA